jgi:glycosyltransferase involved in cell wall biosynthesis
MVVNLGIESPPAEDEGQRAAFLEKFPHLKNRRFALFLGRIHPKKGCDHLISAFSKVAQRNKDLDLVIAGPDPLEWRSELERLIVPSELKNRITWTGMLRGGEKWGVLRSAEVFVLPSHQENYGIAVVEALACGLPVLISDKVNIWKEIESDGAGWSAGDDGEGCRKLFEKWLSLAPVERLQMRQRAYDCFEKRFQITQTTQKLIQQIQGSLKYKE